MPERGEGATLYEARPDVRQQDKIVRIYLAQDPNLINTPNVRLKPGERDLFLYGVARGIFGNPADASEFLQGIGLPFKRTTEGYTSTFNAFSHDSQMRGVVAALGVGDFNRRDTITPTDFQTFIERLPDPVSAQSATLDLLRRLELSNGPAKRREYEAKIRTLFHQVYGKRWEYALQIGLLKGEAENWKVYGRADKFESENPLLVEMLQQNLELRKKDKGNNGPQGNQSGPGPKAESAKGQQFEPLEMTPWQMLLKLGGFNDVSGIAGLPDEEKTQVVKILRRIAGITYHPDNGMNPNNAILQSLNDQLDKLDPAAIERERIHRQQRDEEMRKRRS